MPTLIAKTGNLMIAEEAFVMATHMICSILVVTLMKKHILKKVVLQCLTLSVPLTMEVIANLGKLTIVGDLFATEIVTHL